ncbi:MAG TPA: family 43 glycosylhydrolase [Draconibacterium sp.]|nr:family 43 glycosylhydrolase [Draconibacterium sp.]
MKLKIRKIFIAGLVLLLCHSAIYQSFGQNTPKEIQKDGVTYKLADRPLYIDPVYNGSTDPLVCYNNEAQKWYMYYTSRRSNVQGLNGIESIHGTPIGIAASDDGGATWEYIGDCNIDYHPDENPTYWAPEVIEYEGTYHMYLSYVPGIFNDWNHPRDIVHLTSKDGINWTSQSVLKLAKRKVIDAGVFQLPSGKWLLWYKNEGVDNEIWYAESDDLYNWTDKGEVELGGVHGEGANVIYWHDKYYMIVDEWKGLSVFSSDDAYNWEKQEEYLIAGIPVEQDEATTTPEGQRPRMQRMIDGTRGNHADIQLANGNAYMFYFSNIPADMNMRGSAVYVQELIHNEDGTISCDPLAPCYINLNE